MNNSLLDEIKDYSADDLRLMFGSGENRHLGAGRKHQFWFNRKSHYLNPFKSYILNSDQTTQ